MLRLKRRGKTFDQLNLDFPLMCMRLNERFGNVHCLSYHQTRSERALILVSKDVSTGENCDSSGVKDSQLAMLPSKAWRVNSCVEKFRSHHLLYDEEPTIQIGFYSFQPQKTAGFPIVDNTFCQSNRWQIDHHDHQRGHGDHWVGNHRNANRVADHACLICVSRDVHSV